MNDQNDQPALEARHCAFFFDVDGTLAEIQPRPELVFIPPATLAALARLSTDGVPVAVISGRPLAQLDALLAPLKLPAAGVHGAERRNAEGELRNLALDVRALELIQRELEHVCREHPGLHLENKSVAFALHFRQAPELEAVARALAEDFAQRYAEVLTLQPGKCVFELKPRGASKGEVIRAFMQEAPFAGRTPVFLGDDLTDEAGFAAVNALGGRSIKVGEGPSEAGERLESVAAVGVWLSALATNLGESAGPITKSD
ncbi:trehalose-phosphatase [Stutzerimonas stutzeri]|uniref:Trehalose 6-phosphate phosphatase n=1 Tax=Stutzerimonas stutzeri KOS6 TaxID=1218352 RepID=A0A061JMC2_STUST|nr:trehalose-phosphatase [Stutzerimonas stutzeri]EWC39339.1 trehalose-phosphatase [Stutzerimonas stutzeri KOS6]